MEMNQLNILLADDDTDDCVFFKDAITELSNTTQLTAVHDGDQLMNYLTDNLENLPHVLFLDLNMPRKNGLECLSEIRLVCSLKLEHMFIFINPMILLN
jgi:CheY-like chemotaxis protein